MSGLPMPIKHVADAIAWPPPRRRAAGVASKNLEMAGRGTSNKGSGSHSSTPTPPREHDEVMKGHVHRHRYAKEEVLTVREGKMKIRARASSSVCGTFTYTCCQKNLGAGSAGDELNIGSDEDEGRR